MQQTRDGDAKTRALIERPSLAMVATGDGQAQAVGPQADSPREMRIREAAYALYLARGQAEGHDVDDWLAAEAALAGEAAAAEPKAAPLTH